MILQEQRSTTMRTKDNPTTVSTHAVMEVRYLSTRGRHRLLGRGRNRVAHKAADSARS